MRNKIAKKLKMEVAMALYVGDDVTEQDVKNDRKTVFASDDFKPVYRARKKNHYKRDQFVKHVDLKEEPEVLKNMLQSRKKKEAFRKHQLQLRKILN